MFNETKAHNKNIKFMTGNRVPEGAVNLAYYYAPPLNSEDNIEIVDSGKLIPENINKDKIKVYERTDNLILKELGTNSREILGDKLLITNRHVDNMPLFYRYKLKDLHYEINGAVDINNNIKLIDKNNKELDNKYIYKVEAEYKETINGRDLFEVYIYTNFESVISEEFKVIYNSHYIKNKIEIIRGTKAFKEVDIEKFGKEDNENYFYVQKTASPGKCKVYCKSKAATNTEKYWVVPLNNNVIKVEKPIKEGNLKNWYLRIKNGRFNTVKSGVTNEYYIPEYYGEKFDEEYGLPYKKISNEEVEVIDKNRIQLKMSPLFIDIDDINGGFKNIKVSIDKKNEIIDLNIKSYDLENSIIEVEEVINDNDKVICTYNYEEKYYEYTGYFDVEKNQFIYLNLNPFIGKFTIENNTEWKKENFEDISSFNLLNKVIYIYINKKNEDYISVFHSFNKITKTGIELIGEVLVRANSSKDSVSIIDARKRGGGLNEKIDEEAIKKATSRNASFWEITHWDGEPYSENSVIIVRLPKYILKEFGGQMKKSDIEAAIEKYIAYGTMYIIEYIEESNMSIEMPKNIIGEAGSLDIDEEPLEVLSPEFLLEVEE